jgi:hypothetical protein
MHRTISSEIGIKFYSGKFESDGAAEDRCIDELGIHGTPCWLINGWLFD